MSVFKKYDQRASFVEYYDVPDDCIFIKTGYVVTMDYYKANTDSLVIGGENTKRIESSHNDNSGTYVANLMVGESDTVIYARAYVQHYDHQGEVKTLYSEISSVCTGGQ